MEKFQNLNLICQTETGVTKTIDEIGNWLLNNRSLLNEEKTYILYFELRNFKCLKLNYRHRSSYHYESEFLSMELCTLNKSYQYESRLTGWQAGAFPTYVVAATICEIAKKKGTCTWCILPMIIQHVQVKTIILRRQQSLKYFT